MIKFLKWVLVFIVLALFLSFLGSYICQLVRGKERDIFLRIITFIRENPSIIVLIYSYFAGIYHSPYL
jgi:hypothetical protein